MARVPRKTRKKRSGWIHPLDINRNHRRCAKRRRSANLRARRAVLLLQHHEMEYALAEARAAYLGCGPSRRLERGGPDRSPARPTRHLTAEAA